MAVPTWVALLVAAAGPAALAPDRGGRPVGVNLAAVNDWSREWAFVDAFKASREWVPVGGGDLKSDPAGNPLLPAGRSAWTLVLRDQAGHYPAGRYAATWTGRGGVSVRRYDVSRVVRQVAGRAEVDVKPADGGIQIDLEGGPPADPPRDFRVWLPGFENARSAFHPLFIKRLGPARVVRFMDWQRTNGSPLQKWADRPTPADARYSTDRGVPAEVMVALANEAKVDPWFCVPHRADDDFVRQFARLVKARLDPARTAYVEFSNEVWNWQFPQTKWASERGKAAKLGDPEHGRAYSERAVEVFKLWEAEFGRDRLVRVLASQAAVPWLSEQIVGWKDAYKHADAVAVAPYFGNAHGDPKTATAVARKPVGELLDELGREVDGPNRELIRQQAAVARKHNLRLLAYEGGQHLAGFHGAENDAALTRLFQAANRHPRMYDLYRRHLRHWAEAGGDVFVAYSNVSAPSKWGSWGLLEYQDQPAEDAPKYRAVLDHAAGR